MADYRERLKEERNRQRWAHLMSAGYTVRTNDKPWNLDISGAPTIVDNDVIVGYSDNRMIGQRHVTQIIVRPFGMGRDKWE